VTRRLIGWRVRWEQWLPRESKWSDRSSFVLPPHIGGLKTARWMAKLVWRDDETRNVRVMRVYRRRAR